MRVRLQIVEGGVPTLDTELQFRNRFAAIHELLKTHGVRYNPDQLQQRGNWLNLTKANTVYRVSTHQGG